MKKKSDEDLGILITREIKSIMLNEKMSAEDRIAVFGSIVNGTQLDDPVLEAVSEALKTGFNHANETRKASIYAKRERERKRQRQSTAIIDNQRQSMTKAANHCQLPIYGNGNGNGNNNPLPPKGGKGEKIPKAISPDEILGEGVEDPEKWADEFAEELGKWYPYEVNQDGLRKILIGKAKKNLRRALEQGLEAWIDSGAWSEQRFMPQDIVKWIKLERFLDKPPEKKTPAARESDVPTADETSAVLADEGE